jgi:ribosomal protein L33
MAAKKPFLKMMCSACKNVNYFTKKSKAVAETKLEMQNCSRGRVMRGVS